MSQGPRRFFWPVVKVVLTVAIVLFVGRHFARDLGGMRGFYEEARNLRVGWLLTAAFLYVLGLGFSLICWFRILQRLGQHPGVIAAIRAYYVGHMGKYLPGKAWALALRSGLIQSDRVRVGVAVATSFYEVLTTMAGAVLLAGLLAAMLIPIGVYVPGTVWRLITGHVVQGERLDGGTIVLFASFLLCAVGTPLIPPVFNRVVRRLEGLVRRLEKRGSAAKPIPKFGWGSLLEGLLWTAAGWLVLGASLWTVVESVAPGGRNTTWPVWGRYSSYLGVAYVAGFVVFPIPSGLGVREHFLNLFLSQEFAVSQGVPEEQARRQAAFVVVILRLVWTAAEIIVVSLVYWLPGPGLAQVADAAAESESLEISA